MSTKSGGEKAYAKEEELLEQFKALSNNPDLDKDAYLGALKDMCKSYDGLLGDIKLLTSLGDRLQRKLKSANQMLKEQSEEIQRINNNLTETNIELKLTIDELTKSRASRKAQAILLIVAVVAFIASELLENAFDNWIQSVVDTFKLDWDVFWVGMAFKVALVFLFKPIEGFLEKLFLESGKNKGKKNLIQKYFKVT